MSAMLSELPVFWLNFALHTAESEDPCAQASRYEAHWDFWFRSLRAQHSGPVLWHTGLTTHFAEFGPAPNRPIGAGDAPAGYPRGARRTLASERRSAVREGSDHGLGDAGVWARARLPRRMENSKGVRKWRNLVCRAKD